MRVPLQRVPIPEWRHAHARSSGPARRRRVPAPCLPDLAAYMKEVAYREFEVVGLKRPGPAGVKDPRLGTGTGFIVVAAGRHESTY